ncbi:MAG: hypothetical protein H0V68_01675 [Actinobacteria bacterium]|nr:hypothetical protein [Actinomycetota bacterium]
MGKRGSRYGSEDHLRRYMAEKKRVLNGAVAEASGVRASAIRWLDFPKSAAGNEREFKGIEYIDEGSGRQDHNLVVG